MCSSKQYFLAIWTLVSLRQASFNFSLKVFFLRTKGQFGYISFYKQSAPSGYRCCNYLVIHLKLLYFTVIWQQKSVLTSFLQGDFGVVAKQTMFSLQIKCRNHILQCNNSTLAKTVYAEINIFCPIEINGQKMWISVWTVLASINVLIKNRL